MRPVIGILTDPFRDEYSGISAEEIDKKKLNYVWQLERLTAKISSCISAAGGMPVTLRATDNEEEIEMIASAADGFLLAGGSDIEPSYYGETSKGSDEPDKERDAFEFALLKRVIHSAKPIFGICRGLQVINVFLGGTLYQDIPSENPKWTLHRRSDVMTGYVHSVNILKPVSFGRRALKTLDVNSMHHQAVRRLADSLEVTAITDDGLIEGADMPGGRYLSAVQWHPECLAPSDKTAAFLFADFVRASSLDK